MQSEKGRVAIAGAGIYGSTVAMRLAEDGYRVDLFDPLGVLRAASAINQYRVHSGYHYPRSPETILETLEARNEFLEAFAPAIVRTSSHYYAIPKEGSRTAPLDYETVMAAHQLPLRRLKPAWMNFDFIDVCYEVQESIYDPDILREFIAARLDHLNVKLYQEVFTREDAQPYDFVVYATYGLGPSAGLFPKCKVQVAEKMLIQLPSQLQQVALVVVDGPFTAFDPYGNTKQSLFGSAKNTNHWTSTDPGEPIPLQYAPLLNQKEFFAVDFTRFAAMREDCALSVPAAARAEYLGSRFTLRVVEDNAAEDRRTLYLKEPKPREFHIFSGKVVSAVKAARLVSERIASYG